MAILQHSFKNMNCFANFPPCNKTLAYKYLENNYIISTKMQNFFNLNFTSNYQYVK